MRKITDIQELRHLQMGILDHIHHFCEARHITYFLSSGSLLGAVRHGGYIPWDDDIDIYMPRAEYERLLASFADDSGRYRLIDPAREHHYFYTFAKMVDTHSKMIEDETQGYEIGIYVDIFPVDYVSDDLKERRRVFRLKKLLYKIRRCKISRQNPLNSSLAYWCYRLLPVSVGMLNHWIEKLIVRREPTTTVCHMTEAGPDMSCCFPAADIASAVDIKFEDRTYKTMVGYKDYLARTYGDYMQLPPVEQRTTHHFTAWRL